MRHASYALLLLAVAGCGNDRQVTDPPAPLAHAAHVFRYDVVKITTGLGGTNSRGLAINNRGDVAGFSTLPGNALRHAVLWQGGALTDLGSLGGAGTNSTVAWIGLNDHGTVVGLSQTADPEPLGESWSCSAFFSAATATGKICLGFVWRNGVMSPLRTLGGNNGYATAINNRGQAVGWAETTVHDPTCNGNQVLQFRATLWETGRNRVRELRPLPGDSTSAATAINERGQVVGISGDCDVAIGQFSARHMVIWNAGQPSEIPHLGGTNWHTATAINERGTVVGFSNPPGDMGGTLFIPHAFLWTPREGTRDLGTLPGETTSLANAINARGQVVGVSGSRAFLWHDGTMMDLNTLVGPGFADRLASATDINDAGQITGRLVEAGTGRSLPFVATPVTP